MAGSPGSQLAAFASAIRLSHSVFALPFIVAALLLVPWAGGFGLGELVWIVVAAVAARTAAMGFNRIADARIDAANPRTQNREIPSGKLHVSTAWLLTLSAAALFELAAFQLGPPCPQLAPVVLAILFGYSLTKRFTWSCHLFLGLALACGPLGASVAVGAGLPAPILWLGLGVGLWVAGFDILYACQDHDFDAGGGARSIPGRFGIRRALIISSVLHVAALGAFVGTGWSAGLGWPFWLALVPIAGLLALQHSWVKPDDLSRINRAFFDLNAWVSVAFCVAVAADRLLVR
jgi:4-hydroxybenzoate polyprenyltransferase